MTGKNSYTEGIAALNAEKNMAREKIIYLALVIIHKFNLMPIAEAKKLLIDNLDSGKVLHHWNKGN